MFDIDAILFAVSVWALPVIVAITFHEAAHGFVARMRGDDTAYRLGRVTFNPIAHVDPVGTFLIPGALLLLGAPFLFGYAKPVPVQFSRLTNPRWDMILVALAGPGVNILLAFVSALLFHLVVFAPDVASEWLAANLRNSIVINLVLAVFNMLPIPPLDGGRVAVGLLPYRLALPLARLERVGFLIIVGLLFILPLLGREFGLELNFLAWIIGSGVSVLFDVVVTLAGLT